MLDPSPVLPVDDPSAIPTADAVALRILPVLLTPPQSAYSIRLADQPGAPCIRCETATGIGPIGDLAGTPICDRCFLADCHELGLILALVAFARGFGGADPDDREARDRALAELARFADIFEHVAAAWGPPRPAFDLGEPTE